MIKLLGNRSFGSETLIAYELGYRWKLKQALFVDLAAYYDVYGGLASVELDPTFVDPRDGKTVIPVVNKNLTDGVAKGGEASLTLTAVRWWRLVGSYTWLLLTLEPKGRDINRGALFARATPRNQVAVQSYLDLPARFQLDIFFRYASSVPAAAELVAGQDTPAYATFDVRLAWQALQHLDLSLVGRNLAQDHHREFPGASEVKRSFYARLAGRF